MKKNSARFMQIIGYEVNELFNAYNEMTIRNELDVLVQTVGDSIVV